MNPKPSQFGSPEPLKPSGQGSDAYHCSQCEAMLTDVLDGTLSETEQAAFDLHLVGCPACTRSLAEARRGHAWLEMLRDSRPVPSAALLDRILAQTVGSQVIDTLAASTQISSSQSSPTGYAPSGSPFLLPGGAVPTHGKVLPFRARAAHAFRHTVLQPRLAMTAAMAFFSVALTLNLTGVHLSQLRASDLRPSSLRRDFYDANARAVRTFDNLRVVYELESRVRDLQRASDSDALAPAQNEPSPEPARPSDGSNPDAQPGPNQKQSRPKPGPGSSQRNSPAGVPRSLGFARNQHHPGNPVVLTEFVPGARQSKSEGGRA